MGTHFRIFALAALALRLKIACWEASQTLDENGDRKMKRMTPTQSRRTNRLIKNMCCNYHNGNCILLDNGDVCVCPQIISYTVLCKWFAVAVLPLDKELFTELTAPDNEKRCAVCQNTFISKSNSVKYCPACREQIRREQAAARMRALRRKSNT